MGLIFSRVHIIPFGLSWVCSSTFQITNHFSLDVMKGILNPKGPNDYLSDFALSTDSPKSIICCNSRTDDTFEQRLHREHHNKKNYSE